MATNQTELNALPIAQSRAEKYLSHMTGRTSDINSLPEPISRLDHYLEYLCRNGGTGGSGGVANAFNSIEQTESVINFKSDNTTRATLEIITDEEINTIINSLT